MTLHLFNSGEVSEVQFNPPRTALPYHLDPAAHEAALVNYADQVKLGLISAVPTPAPATLSAKPAAGLTGRARAIAANELVNAARDKERELDSLAMKLLSARANPNLKGRDRFIAAQELENLLYQARPAQTATAAPVSLAAAAAMYTAMLQRLQPS